MLGKILASPCFTGNLVLNTDQLQQQGSMPYNNINNTVTSVGAVFPEQSTMPVSDWRYELAEPQHPVNLDVELPRCTEFWERNRIK